MGELWSGVIEGFYGPPWSQAERFELFSLMEEWGLGAYVYAPKDDLKQRAIWRKLYTASEAQAIGQLIRACKERGLCFVYALSPGLDIQYSDDRELECLQHRFAQLIELGCSHFALLFDDVPDRLNPADLKRWGSLACAQSYVANGMCRWLGRVCSFPRFFFCPTAYCGRMADNAVGGEDYLPTLGRELMAEIDVFWTGPEIISREIPLAHIRALEKVLGRKPVIWDNLHANDYDGRRFYCGPYAGRSPELRSAVSGLLLNPNVEFPLNYVPLRTFAEFLRTESWGPREAYLAALREWLPRFDTVGESLSLQELLLFCDSYYLPYEDGAEAEALYQLIRHLLTANPAAWGGDSQTFYAEAARLRTFCSRVTELRCRPLFHALSRRVWELREEVDLLEHYVRFKSDPGNLTRPFRSDFHLPGTYRGGLAARLQRLLEHYPDGTLAPASAPQEGQAAPSRL